MKGSKFFLFLCLTISGFGLIAQPKINFNLKSVQNTYNNLIHQFPIASSNGADFAVGDIDNDGDNDVVVASNSPKDSIFFFLNDGNGNFTNYNVPSVSTILDLHTIRLGYFNSDSLLDIFIAGGIQGSPNSGVGRDIYINNGNYTFQKILNNGLPIIEEDTPFDIGDFDDDGDQDFIFSGFDTFSSTNNTDVYVNNGQGSFTRANLTSLADNQEGDVKFFNANGDSLLDIVLIGFNYGRQADVYINNSIGSNYSFSLDTNANLIPTFRGKISIGDIDNDNDDDLLIYGRESGSVYNTRLYLNTGSNYLQVPGIPFPNTDEGDFIFKDINLDGLVDVFGVVNNLDSMRNEASLYLNNGNGSFSSNRKLINTEPGETKLVEDLNGDSLPDYLGKNNYSLIIAFLQDANQNFVPVLPEYSLNRINQIIDVNADSLPDLLIDNIVYFNQGNFTFQADTLDSLYIAQGKNNAMVDINNDSILDFITSGFFNGQSSTFFFIGDSSGNYTLNTSSTFHGTNFVLEDVDNDNDIDIFIWGSVSPGVRLAQIYLNDGTGTFTSSGNSFPSSLSPHFYDSDNDGDLDLLLCGFDNGQRNARLYLNNGSGVFTYLTNTAFTPVSSNSVTSGDYDNDGDEDVIIAGSISTFVNEINYYENLGFNIYNRKSYTFDFQSSATLNSLDIDNDGDLDLLQSGRNPFGITKTIIHLNDSGNFTPTTIPNIIPAVGANFHSDFDNDGDEDLIIGYLTSVKDYTAIYENTTCFDRFDTLSITSCNQYYWSVSNITYTSSGNYIDTSSLNNGCDSVRILDLTISTIDTSISIVGDSLVSNELNSNYQWVDCGNGYSQITGETSRIFSPSQTGSYAVVVNNGVCSDTSSCNNIIITDIKENFIKSEFLIRPNPTSGGQKVQVLLTPLDNNIPIRLYDLRGVLLQRKFPTTKKTSFDVSMLKSGVYIIEYNGLHKKLIIAD